MHQLMVITLFIYIYVLHKCEVSDAYIVPLVSDTNMKRDYTYGVCGTEFWLPIKNQPVRRVDGLCNREFPRYNKLHKNMFCKLEIPQAFMSWPNFSTSNGARRVCILWLQSFPESSSFISIVFVSLHSRPILVIVAK